MATVAQVPQDQPQIVGLASSFTVYSTYVLAQAAAIALSAANSSAPVYTAEVDCVVYAGGAIPGGRVDLEPGTPTAWIVQLVSTGTFLPRSNAIAQAYATSAANGNAATFVGDTFQICTGP